MFQQKFSTYQLKPSADAKFQQGVAYQKAGSVESAKALYEEILRMQPDHADALHFLGIIEDRAMNHTRAIELIAKAIVLNPTNPACYLNMGNAQSNLKQFDAAIASYNSAIQLMPDYALAYVGRGAALEKQSQFDEAVASFDAAISLNPGLMPAHYNRGNTLRAMRKFEAAIASFDAAIALDRNLAAAYLNRGSTQWDLRQLDEAVLSFDEAIAAKPDYAEAYRNKAAVLLTMGVYDQGWKLYEWRWKLNGISRKYQNAPQPLWLGSESIQGKTILLYAEQGLGDSIQFCRYAELVAALGARVVMEMPTPLIALFRTLKGVDELVATGEPLPEFDYQCPLLSMPLAFNTTLESIPNNGAYLRSDAAKLLEWSKRLGDRKRTRVGLVWRGNKNYADDHLRSFSLAAILPYLPDGFEYISLQKDIEVEDRATLDDHTNIRSFEDYLTDFTDTAALCDLMDLVISVDTGVAHLSGALGKPTWVMLPFISEWRWLMDRSDSPWYSSVKLYRQPAAFDWPTVFNQINSDLSVLLTNQ